MTAPGNHRRPPYLRRSWLFVPGADQAALEHAGESQADVLIQELEDFTVPERRAEARQLSAATFDHWRRAGALAAIRINPLEAPDGMPDLEAAMAGKPDIVMLPKTVTAAQIEWLDQEIGKLEKQHGIGPGTTEIVPNIETAAGLVALGAIAAVSERVTAMLVASEDMAADLGIERTRGGSELDHVRARFLIECVAANVVAIDCPYTFSDNEGLAKETGAACKMGYRAKSAVSQNHPVIINAAMTPSAEDIAKAEGIISAFEAARSDGIERADHQGHLVEVPSYNAARRLLARVRAFAEFDMAARNY